MRQQNFDNFVAAKNEQAGADTTAFLFLRRRRIFHLTYQRPASRNCKSADNAERYECCRVNAGSDRQKMISLVTRDRGAGERAHLTVDFVTVITELLQLSLNTGDDLVRRKPVITINRFVVLIIRVRVVTPG